MRTIYKYPLQVTDCQVIEMPIGSRILAIQMQRGVPCLWATVDPEEEKKEKRFIRVVGTGHELSEYIAYIGTYQMADGALVWHVFETKEG